MEAGRELDALIAEKVMHWGDEAIRAAANAGYGLDLRGILPHYSTNIAAAWELVLKFKMAVIPVGNTWRALVDGDALTEVSGWYEVNLDECPTGDTAPHAICLAALKALA